MNASTAVVHDPQHFELSVSQRGLIRWHVYVGFAALSIGIINGLGQALNYAGVDILQYFPGMRTYYQGLTVHGVVNALVFTFAFANGFMAFTTARGLNRELNKGLLHASLWTMVAAILLAGFAMFSGRASVLFTFYSPLQAHWTFYLGAALLVISTWITSANLFITLAQWRRENPGTRIPLMAFVSVTTFVMWDIASLGIAVEVVGFLLPWSLGLISGVDPLLNRTLFWFTGHPIVYFWLLPAYVSWYTMVPKMAGGRLFSDTVTRVVFIMFLVLSIPVGFHHQYTDPGIPASMKFIHAVLTFGVFYPSLITAFSIVAALELGGRNRGGRGLLGWIPALPWGDPALSTQMIAMLVFVLGGITGLINASFSVNQVIHNTTWVPGHFHMTVGTAVALSAMGIAYWLIPWLKDRELWGRKIALAQGWIYGVGVLVMGRGLASGGLDGMPRRTDIVEAVYRKPSWELAGILTGIGGTLMFVAGIMFFVVLVGTIFLGRPKENQVVPATETMHPPATSGWAVQLDRLGLWAVVAIVLILLAYGPFLVKYLPPALHSQGFKFF